MLATVSLESSIFFLNSEKSSQNRVALQALSISTGFISTFIGVLLICVGSGAISFSPGRKFEINRKQGHPDKLEMLIDLLSVISGIGLFLGVLASKMLDSLGPYFCPLILFIIGFSLVLGYFKPHGFIVLKNRRKAGISIRLSGILLLISAILIIFITSQGLMSPKNDNSYKTSWKDKAPEASFIVNISE